MTVPSDTIVVRKLNETYIKIAASDSIRRELSDYFRFRPEGFQFDKRYQIKIWDGWVRIFQLSTNKLYLGLIPSLLTFAAPRGYKVLFANNLHEQVLGFEKAETMLDETHLEPTKQFFIDLKLPGWFETREHQLKAHTLAVNQRRGLLISPTGSGKTFMMYSIIRHFNTKTLIICPKVDLVTQIYDEFLKYSQFDQEWDTYENLHVIYGDQPDKFGKKPITVSTWQSIYKHPDSWFKQFDLVIGDEVHNFEAKNLKDIMERCSKAQYRFGFTGTLKESKVHRTVLIGLFGKVYQVTTTKKLVEEKVLSKLKVNILVLDYQKEVRKQARNLKYSDEVRYLTTNTKRNDFIAKLALLMKTNTLVLYHFTQHGKYLYELIKSKNTNPDRKVFFVYGETPVLMRNEIKEIFEKEVGAIIVAQSKVYSEGVNVKNLENLIFAMANKSQNTILQSLGRTMRIGNTDQATAWDIVDDLCWKSRQNFAFLHGQKRREMYDAEQHDYQIVNLEFKQ